MYIKLMITLVTCSILLLGACQNKSVQIENGLADGDGMGDGIKASHAITNHDFRTPLWEAAYDNFQLKESVKQQIRRWKETEHEIPYSIHSRLNDERTDIVGLFRTVDDWELLGTTKKNQTFSLKSNDEKVTLEYDEYEEELAKAEVSFLVPLQHLYVIEELLEGNEFEWIIWKEENQTWSVQIKSSTEPLFSSFQHFLFSHLTEDQFFDAHSLEEYSLTYDLMLYKEREQYKIKSLQFSLEKRDSLLEELQFHF